MRNKKWNNLFLSVTGVKNQDWQEKIAEINELGITKVAVFLERFKETQRDHLYKFLLDSKVEEVPLVHLRHDVAPEEIQFFIDNFSTQRFNIHENHFKLLDKWKGYWDKLYLEMNTDSEVAKEVKVRRIGGFCIDLAHFKKAVARGAEEAYYVFLKRNKIEFECNHISGYSEEQDTDMHVVNKRERFDYLEELPIYLFGKVMALEIDNNIKEQIKFRKYILKVLKNSVSK